LRLRAGSYLAVENHDRFRAATLVDILRRVAARTLESASNRPTRSVAWKRRRRPSRRSARGRSTCTSRIFATGGRPERFCRGLPRDRAARHPGFWRACGGSIATATHRGTLAGAGATIEESSPRRMPGDETFILRKLIPSDRHGNRSSPTPISTFGSAWTMSSAHRRTRPRRPTCSTWLGPRRELRRHGNVYNAGPRGVTVGC